MVDKFNQTFFSICFHIYCYLYRKQCLFHSSIKVSQQIEWTKLFRVTSTLFLNGELISCHVQHMYNTLSRKQYNYFHSTIMNSTILENSYTFNIVGVTTDFILNWKRNPSRTLLQKNLGFFSSPVIIFVVEYALCVPSSTKSETLLPCLRNGLHQHSNPKFHGFSSVEKTCRSKNLRTKQEEFHDPTISDSLYLS